MAYRRKYNKPRPAGYIKRRKVVRKRFQRKRRVQRQLGVSRYQRIGFPGNRIVKMRFVHYFQLTSTSGAISAQAIKANCVYRPVGTAHDAIGYGLWSPLYNKYVVIGSKCVWRIIGDHNQTTNGGPPSWFHTSIQDNLTYVAGDFEAVAENGGGRNKLYHTLEDRQCIMVSYFSPKKFLNLTNIKDNIADVGTSFGTDPQRMAYHTIQMQTVDKATTTSVYVVATVDYLVLMSEPTEQAKSTI